MSKLKKVTLNAARSKAFPEGSIRHGYQFVAPLTEDGKIDREAWKAHRGECFVRRFWADDPEMRGLLVHRPSGQGGANWASNSAISSPTRRRGSASPTTPSRPANTCRCARRTASW